MNSKSGELQFSMVLPVEDAFDMAMTMMNTLLDARTDD